MVIDSRRLVLGVVRASDLTDGQRPRAGDVMGEGPSTYRPNVSADELAPKLDDDHPPWVLITTSEGILVGVAAADAVRAAAKPS